jgi:hypothetical protein
MSDMHDVQQTQRLPPTPGCIAVCETLFALAVEHDFEDVVGKRMDSQYLAGSQASA